jgi:hypothetical protein
MQCAVVDPCTELCGPAVAAACDAGPPTVAACVEGCSGVAGSGCIGALTALATCVGTGATASCNAMDLPVYDGCETEHADFMACSGP